MYRVWVRSFDRNVLSSFAFCFEVLILGVGWAGAGAGAEAGGLDQVPMFGDSVVKIHAACRLRLVSNAFGNRVLGFRV